MKDEQSPICGGKVYEVDLDSDYVLQRKTTMRDLLASACENRNRNVVKQDVTR